MTCHGIVMTCASALKKASASSREQKNIATEIERPTRLFRPGPRIYTRGFGEVEQDLDIGVDARSPRASDP
jgi:hypothetical protein